MSIDQAGKDGANYPHGVCVNAHEKFDCVEVGLFRVDRSEIASEKNKRSAMNPTTALAAVQESIVLEVPRSISCVSGMYAIEESCPNAETAVIVVSTISDYKKGGKAFR